MEVVVHLQGQGEEEEGEVLQGAREGEEEEGEERVLQGGQGEVEVEGGLRDQGEGGWKWRQVGAGVGEGEEGVRGGLVQQGEGLLCWLLLPELSPLTSAPPLYNVRQQEA